MNHYRLLHLHLCRQARRCGGPAPWLALRVLPAVLLCALVLLALGAPFSLATVSGEGVALADEELASGHMLLQAGEAGHYVPALLQSSKVDARINGLIATVVVEQSFSNQTGQWLEGVYAFPLPDKAAVRAMEMRIGERRIVGEIREKAQAQKEYAQARAQGKKASLVEQQRPNLFTNRVANIGPGETIVVRLEYVQEVDYRAGVFSLRFPTTITPRYMPGAPLASSDEGTEVAVAVNPYLGWASPTRQVPDADAISPLQYPQPGSERAPLNPLEIKLRLDMGMPLARVDAPFHEIALARRAGVYSVQLAEGVTEMDRDFVLSWEPVSGAEPTAALFTEEVDGQYYGLLMVVPPASQRAGPAPAREIIFVVDTSGSMGGVSIRQARNSVARALRELRPRDRFNIIEFNSNFRSLYRRPVSATQHHIQQAQEFVRQLQASGGTEMLPALRAALSPPATGDLLQEQLPLRQVIFITDGAVGNELALFEHISTMLGNSRLFTVGIGSAPNSWFMREAARFGRGTHTHIGNIEQVEEKMAMLFAQLAQPAAVDLTVSWPGKVEAWPARMPDLYLGEPLSVAVSFGESPPAGDVVVGAQVGDRSWRQVVQLTTGADPLSNARHQGVASVWARRKIAGLLDQGVMGRSKEEVRAEVLPLALAHRLLSPFTSFLAVEHAVSRPADSDSKSVPVPNTRPKGQTPQGFAYPRTATTGPAKLWLGMLCLFLAIILRMLRAPETDHAPASRD